MSTTSPDGAAFPWERPLGARPLGDGTVEFRVWAPRAESIALRIGRRDHALDDAGFGVHEATVEAEPGDRYWFVLDGRRLPDPCSRWQPKGLRGPSAVLDDHPGAALGDPVAGRARHLRAARRHLHRRRGRSRRPRPTSASSRRSASRRSRSCRWPSSRHHGLGLRRGLHLRAAFGLRRPRGAGRAGRGRARAPAERDPRRRLQPRRRLGRQGARPIRALLHPKYETPWGQAINYDGANCDPVREWVLQSAEGWVRDFGIDGLRLDAIHAIYDSSAEHIVAAIARRVHAVRDDALVIAESGLNDPRVMRLAELGGLRLRRRLGRRLPPRAADPADRRARGLLRGVRPRGPARQGVSPPARPRRQLLGVPPAAVRRAGRRRPAATVRGLLPEPRPGRQPRLRRPAARVRAPAGRVLHAAVAVRAAAVHGRGVRRDRRRFSSSPTTSTSGSPTPRARAGGASSPRSRSSARRSPTRRIRPRSSAPSSRAGATRRWPACTRSCCCAAPRCRRATPTRSSSTRTPAGCAYAGARSSSSATSPRAPSGVPCVGTQRRAVHPRAAADRRRIKPNSRSLSGALIA